ncbi:MAG: SRPBCC family protein [Bacteroidia bacterium]|jgi:uncharacterized protein YndB with AHSA1/START domain|nr:SRPBCC family protein [Bacteroidia bacterium]
MKTAILSAAVLGFTATSFTAQPTHEFRVNVNDNAPVKCSKTILIHAAPEKVWKVLTDINRWPNWYSPISQAALKDSLAADAAFRWKMNGTSIQSQLHTVKENELFGWTGQAMGTVAIHNWTFIAEDGKTRVEVDESMDGFMAKLFSKMLRKNLEQGMNTWLEALKQECEK